MSDDNKLKLGARPALGLKRTESAGNVKQSFSHGRTNTVQVEVKRRRVLTRPGEAPPAPAPAPDPTLAPPPVVEAAPPPVAPAAPLSPPVMFTPVVPVKSEPPAPPPPPVEIPAATAPAATRPAAPPQRREETRAQPNDLMSRQERQALLLRQAEEDRLRSGEEMRLREERERAEAAEAERTRLEERRAQEEEAARRAAEAPAVEAMPTATPLSGAAARAAEEERARGFRPGAGPARRPEPAAAKPARNRTDDRRQSGKLTVTRALDSDDSVRVRSLAALRRAREKDKRAHQAGGPQVKQVRDVVVPEAITVQELANRMAERAGDLVKSLFKMGMPVASTDTIDQDTAELLVTEFGHSIKRVSESDVEIGVNGDEDVDHDLQPRAPVVTIMGHVDHGKTSLLDALRGTDVVAGEAGGITQHIGAYQVTMRSGDRITFLDTPGHEAFTEMRARGANVTDIVVLVVAADDGLMPQTIEAINHTKAAGVPMIVAINKIDKPGADVTRVRTELLSHEVVVEEMSGDVQDVEVSALKKTGLDELAEKISIQAELMELKANPNRPAEGTVIEARLDKGRGPLATVLVNRGTLKVGDVFVIGAEWGKVRALVDDKGKQVKTAGPSVPVEVLGLSGVPNAGDPLSVVENEARAREVAEYRAGLVQRKRTTVAPTTVENMFSALKANRAQEYPLIVKADVQGSVEAIVSAVNRISTDDIKARVLHAGVGAITESDVTLARASNAPIVGFNVRPNAKAREIAERDKVRLMYYDVIYALTDAVKAEMAGQLGPEYHETVVGRAKVQDVFQAGKTGKAAGILVTEGIIRKSLRARVTRDDVIIYNGAIASLRRFKDDVSEVGSGVECGITLEGSSDVKAGDYIETFEVEERQRTL